MSLDIHARLQELLTNMRGDWVLTHVGSSWHLEGGAGKKAVPNDVAELALERGLIEVFRSRSGIAQYCISAAGPKGEVRL